VLGHYTRDLHLGRWALHQGLTSGKVRKCLGTTPGTYIREGEEVLGHYTRTYIWEGEKVLGHYTRDLHLGR